ncbi:MAG: hypothetical protein VYD54_14970 [Bdellovibrionota bacterium]|nr:hypothetical protein [Bdellovibrionota bacterium]
MTQGNKLVFSKEKSSKPEDLLKFTIHDQLAMEPDGPEEHEETEEKKEKETKENSLSPSSQREMEERYIHQLKAEKAKLKENLQIDFARRSSIMEKEVKKVLLALLKSDPNLKKYLLKIQKILSDFTKKTTED